jgi:hypothetical protein
VLLAFSAFSFVTLRCDRGVSLRARFIISFSVWERLAPRRIDEGRRRERGRLAQEASMNINSGGPWSEMDVWELKNSMEYGRSFAEVAGFLYRDESEVRQMAMALGLKEGGGMGEVLRAVSGLGGLEGRRIG